MWIWKSHLLLYREQFPPCLIFFSIVAQIWIQRQFFLFYHLLRKFHAVTLSFKFEMVDSFLVPISFNLSKMHFRIFSLKKDQTCNLHMRYPHLSFFLHIHQRIHGWHINQSTWNIKFCLSFTFSLSSLSSMISAIAMILNIKLLIRTQGTWIWIWI